MEYLIIVAVVALALAPLSHFIPSRRQRAVAKMREFAAVQGLFVEFRQLPGQGRAHTGAGRSSEGVIYYGKRLPPARGAGTLRGSWVRSDAGWRSSRGIGAPPDILQELPAAVLAASVDEGSCGIYWRETGSSEELADIVTFIKQWAAKLRPGDS